MTAEAIRNELVLLLAKRAELDEQISRARAMFEGAQLAERAAAEAAKAAEQGETPAGA